MSQAGTFEDYIYSNEDRDLVRFTWNSFPKSKAECQALVVPPAVMYSPLKSRADEPQCFPYPPITCGKASCRAVINPYCVFDLAAKVWVCQFCNSRNIFPKNYHSMTESAMAAELLSNFSTIDYIIPRANEVGPQPAPSVPLVFFFVIDICTEEDELLVLKNSIKQAIFSLPKNCHVGLISFAQHAFIHDLSDTSVVPTTFVFNGEGEMNLAILKSAMYYNLNKTLPSTGSFVVQTNQQQQQNLGCRFLQPLNLCENKFCELLNDLSTDPWPSVSGRRALRCTGLALSLATKVIEQCLPNCLGKIVLTVAGPCTVGKGQVVDLDMKNVIRSYHDIEHDKAPFVSKSWKFYTDLARSSIAVDIYSGCLDQTGLLEMRNLCFLTGGNVVMSDSFDTVIFKESFNKAFAFLSDKADKKSAAQNGFNGTIQVFVSHSYKINGCIGHCLSLGKKNEHVSSKEIGIGGTCVWKVPYLDSKSTFAFILDLDADITNSSPLSQFYLQIVTNYFDITGNRRIKVTTVGRPFSDYLMAQQQNSLLNSPQANNSVGQMMSYTFDQDAAAAVVSRMAIYRCVNDDNHRDVLRWVDRVLIKLCQFAASFQPNNPQSFLIPTTMTQFPQYMYHLRRSPFLQSFNLSPDETTFYRYYLLKEDTCNCTNMIQPVLYSYSMNRSVNNKNDNKNGGNELYFTPEPVMLDSDSIKSETVLLLDTFFHVLIYLGQTVDSWKKQNYHMDPTYAAFAMFLKSVENDAIGLVTTRFPVPRYIYTAHGASQARFLLSKVNPRQTHNTVSYGSYEAASAYGGSYGGSAGPDQAMVFTDDISLDAFMEHLKKLVVAVN